MTRPPDGTAAADGDIPARIAALALRDSDRLGRRFAEIGRERDDDARGRRFGKAMRELEKAEARISRRREAVPVVTYPPELPVSERRDDLLAAIRDHQVVVVAGETGSGKTTQLPKLCLELGRGVRGQIAHTQPRRLAARTVAARIADELDVPLGGAVGYGVRFDDRGGDETLIRLVTDGLLLAEIQRDRLLRRYDTVIVDEAHERSLNIDFLLGYLVRLLPQRPDLKVIITSATIETGRFSAHFGDAPVVEVSGRTYPVEIRHRPLVDPEDPEADAERDETDAIGDAIDELWRDGTKGPGDVLVFLSGEREIRDTAETLEGRYTGRDVEVLPLYARLASAEQQRVFRRDRSSAKRRIVLATNVAETSVTVPGIRYVVDPGTARISRYSARLKVQRLPIEPVSQASAAQRAGRCGRVADGICIRLYSEEDHDARPRFTDPEILRTSLAAVILQMASLGLGEIEDFPFLDPPDSRQIRDGIRLLEELGALDPHASAGTRDRLTDSGRRIAQLPVDPRFARMVLEADRLDCAEEVCVIAAALSIQDPRERPVEKRAQADQLHARFRDETSDFLSQLLLWRHLGEEQTRHSRTRFRKRCREEHLHYLRIREWQDLVAQLRTSAKGVGVTFNERPAEAPQIHQALLAGLLSHVGLRDAAKREYAGARGARFQIFPGSALARKGPTWVVVAELVETSRLWGRTAARVDPSWIEPLAKHLLVRSYSEPRWDARRSEVVATETATLYGLPVVKGRTVSYGRIDAALSRELFIRRALVEDDWSDRHAFLAENRRRVHEIEALEERMRRRGILAPDEARVAFFEARIPAEVSGGRAFERWWRDARREDPDLLTYSQDVLVDPSARDAVEPKAFPTAWKQGDVRLGVSYRFEPGAPDDGVTVHVPLSVAGRLDPGDFDWLVPGLRHELVVALMRGLPKDVRRPLVPIPETADAVLARIAPRRAPLLDAVAAAIEEQSGLRVPREAWDPDRLPAHLRPRFQIEGEDGEVLGAGGDLAALRTELRPRLQERLAAATPGLEASGLRTWSIGGLPRTIAVPGTGGDVEAYPSLVDEGETAGVRVLDDPRAQELAMAAGTRRLLLLTSPSPVRWVRDRLDIAAQVTLSGAPLGGLDATLDDATGTAVDALVAEAGGPAWDEEAFARLRGHVAGNLAERTAAVTGRIAALAGRRAEVFDGLLQLEGPGFDEAREDMDGQLARLVHPGFATRAGEGRLDDIDRYLAAMLRRIERLRAAPASDAGPRTTVRALEDALAATRAAVPEGRPHPAALVDARWMIEEVRVSLFAQALGTRGKASPKRVQALLAAAAG